MRLIDADDLKEWSEIVPLTFDGGIDINEFDKKLESMPTVDAVPVRHGKWIEHKDYPGMAYLCSECGLFTTMPRYHYCPDCGARMDEE